MIPNQVKVELLKPSFAFFIARMTDKSSFRVRRIAKYISIDYISFLSQGIFFPG